jgi:hypothetical protein
MYFIAGSGSHDIEQGIKKLKSCEQPCMMLLLVGTQISSTKLIWIVAALLSAHTTQNSKPLHKITLLTDQVYTNTITYILMMLIKKPTIFSFKNQNFNWVWIISLMQFLPFLSFLI